jgi:hypothetical protein
MKFSMILGVDNTSSCKHDYNNYNYMGLSGKYGIEENYNGVEGIMP